MNRRRLAHGDRSAVLVHGDIHEMNALQASDGSYKLIDPAGLRAEPACDLGTIVRCNSAPQRPVTMHFPIPPQTSPRPPDWTVRFWTHTIGGSGVRTQGLCTRHLGTG